MAESLRRSPRRRGRKSSDSEPTAESDTIDYRSWTVVTLKKELKSRDLSTQGLKTDLVTRLFESDLENLQSQEMSKRNNTRNFEKDTITTNKVHTVRGDSTRMRKGQNDHIVAPAGEKARITDGLTADLEEEMERQRKLDQKRRHGIVLWRKPIITLQYFFLETIIVLNEYRGRVLKHRKTVSFLVTLTIALLMLYNSQGVHQEYVVKTKSILLWCGYWVGLGILSSVGLGTGLHTFLLYLGPHIASVTLSAWECESLDFPEPPYPDEIICPYDGSRSTVNMWSIMGKVRLEAFMWGAGTAIGELPPYFMARAARLSGAEPDDEELEEVEELERLTSVADQDLWTRAKKFVHDLVERVGFFGILVCASVPNPLFDLAGITCGHCLVPFWTFFGATLIGKAIIKMHLQKTFVILSFSKHYVEAVLNFVGSIPTIGPYIQKPFKIALDKQKEKLHRKPGQAGTTSNEPNILGWVFEKLIIAMVVYFLLSIINSTAQAYAKRLDEQRRQQMLKPSKGE